MSLSIGIVGLPNVGKSSLFNLLTQNCVPAENYPFCTIDPNVGCVKVPDARLDVLAKMSASAKIIPTMVEFTDIAGIVKDAHKGEGLGNKFLANIREVDAICQVVRIFNDPNVIHVSNRVNPKEDKEIIDLELIMADLDTVTKKLDSSKKSSRSGLSKEAEAEMKLLESIKAALDSGRFASSVPVIDDLRPFAKQLNLFTAKPMMVLLNVDESTQNTSIDLPNIRPEDICRINVKLEFELQALSPEEQKEYLKELGMTERGLDRFIQKAYSILELLTFLTTGADETRAWTVRKGTKAPQAAGVIHTDFEKSFIRAEVISYDDFVSCGGESGARDQGKLRVEGKDYVMADGDICDFKVGV
ncbi:MAG: GTP-dependent nucleic acid-binding protein EngD [Parcubacteria group bacterium Gr01-1014_18]|nr:MAG: GTP-dependent nucleic acid-binding protein EngD [Parcubacteria group bacterium Greene0416_36]TSC79683.1 MAG: GTP-dependent nucleic acid-binding protein EngD [Parcubacteria group bacterium Gr01-1014_18]TSC97869.1 MAG: GTP-dependent nucleic acid-binding protein EngD [Parcubacteria group bacterium Greene1014_20]TSD06493.1 MAG: GTP-dependent nucleic acid-binding protein EngD [Parcubacteria group bacterium Greene0714_2]